MKQQTCNPNRLEAFLQSELSQTEEQQLTQHLDECADCREELECLAAERSVWQETTDLLGGAVQRSNKANDYFPSRTVRSPQIEQVLNQLAPTDDPEMLGRIGSYEVSGVVGAGGMGVVLKAHDRSLDRIVAIKVMSPHLASSGSARKRFAREAKAAAAVLHPNVIAIHSVASDDACPYLVMPYVRGASLQKRIDSQGPLPLKDTLRIGAQIAAGLAAAHQQGLVHRDIKPANILLEEGVERVTITDFGLARAVDDASMTCSGVIAGTPQYMSPEQARGEPIDARSDLFSLGSVLYAMCTGRSPFRAETTYGVLHRIDNDSPTPICEVNSDVPEWLSHIIERLMAKRPDDRFESAEQVAELLESCLAHVQHPTATRLPESVPILAPKQSRRPPIGKFIAGAAFVFSLIFAGVLIVLEMNNGTLTIECDADDVPIRIMQGDKIVEKMVVTKGEKSTRIAAGKYVVELSTNLDGIVIEGGAVSLRRGDIERVRITKTSTPKASERDATDSPSSPVLGATWEQLLQSAHEQGGWPSLQEARSAKRDEENRARLEELQGTWDFLSVESDGTITPYTTSTELFIKGNEWTVSSNMNGVNRFVIDGRNLTFHGLTSTGSTSGAGGDTLSVAYGIYALEGDTLTYSMTAFVPAAQPGAFAGPGILNPKGFDTRGNTNRVYRLRRSPKAGPSLSNTLQELQGKWRLTRQIAADGDESITPANSIWEFKGEHVVVRDGGPGAALLIKVDESHSPVHVEVVIETDEESGLGLLSVEGDKLILCLGESQKKPDPGSRPKKLQWVSGIWYMELQRVKPGETIVPMKPKSTLQPREAPSLSRSEATPPQIIVAESQAPSIDRRYARSVVEVYIAAALAGDVAKAAALAKNAPADPKRIQEIRKHLNVQRLKIKTVYVNDPASPTLALATSEAVKLEADHKQPNGQRDGFMVFKLELTDKNWLVTDIDLESESGADKELERFLQANPKSIGLPPIVLNSGKTE